MLMNYSANWADRKTEPVSLLGRIAQGDKTAVKDCIDTHGNLVWSLAKNLAKSYEEAEFLAQEIFIDIWKYAGRFDSTKFDECTFIALIAHRRFIIRLQQINHRL